MGSIWDLRQWDYHCELSQSGNRCISGCSRRGAKQSPELHNHPAVKTAGYVFKVSPRGDFLVNNFTVRPYKTSSYTSSAEFRQSPLSGSLRFHSGQCRINLVEEERSNLHFIAFARPFNSLSRVDTEPFVKLWASSAKW